MHVYSDSQGVQAHIRGAGGPVRQGARRGEYI